MSLQAPDEETLFALRVRYVKRGRLRYLSHLEVLRAVERLVRRAHLPYAVTRGFSPHMKAAYGPALPVGVASRDEWFDVYLTDLAPAGEYLEALRAASAPDLMPQQAAYVSLRSPSLSAALTISEYAAHVVPVDEAGAPVRAGGPELRALARHLEGACSSVLSAGSITYERNGKPKAVALEGKVARLPAVGVLPDVAPEVRDESDAPLPCACVSFATRSSNAGALRPDVLMGAVLASLGRDAAVGREEGPGGSVPGVSSWAERVRVLVVRVAQHLESEDGTWVRPI